MLHSEQIQRFLSTPPGPGRYSPCQHSFFPVIISSSDSSFSDDEEYDVERTVTRIQTEVIRSSPSPLTPSSCSARVPSVWFPNNKEFTKARLGGPFKSRERRTFETISYETVSDLSYKAREEYSENVCSSGRRPRLQCSRDRLNSFLKHFTPFHRDETVHFQPVVTPASSSSSEGKLNLIVSLKS